MRYAPFILQGVSLTVLLSFVGITGGMILGLFIGLGRLSKSPLFSRPSGWYVDLFRGTPLLVQIMFIHYAVPQIFDYRPLPPLYDGMIALGLNSAAYIAEIFRATVGSINKGQMEAARSLGMTHWQAMRYVILPQAIRIAIPPLGNEFVALLKDSSLLFAIGVAETMSKGLLAAGRSYRPFEIWSIVAVAYLVLTTLFARLTGVLERRLAISDRS